jgi:thioredoxin reductase (NADPH)
MEIKKENLKEKVNQIYDCLIIGGGAGGLSAGIYLQRFLLNSLVLEKGKGRSVWIQALNNYLGIPPETPGYKVLKQGKEHYLSLNGDYLNGFAEEVYDKGDHFVVKIKIGKKDFEYFELKSKYLIAASGIIDKLPELENMRNVYDYAGYNLHVCMICDGYEMKDKKCGLLVNSDQAIETAFVLNWFTPKITVLTNNSFIISSERRAQLTESQLILNEKTIKQFLGYNHQMTGIELEDGEIVELETGLIAMGSKYHNNYLKNIQNLQWQGENLIVNEVCRTSHPRIFAIGDLKVGLNQVAVAVGDGANAATTIWREIRKTRKNISINV